MSDCFQVTLTKLTTENNDCRLLNTDQLTQYCTS